MTAQINENEVQGEVGTALSKIVPRYTKVIQIIQQCMKYSYF